MTYEIFNPSTIVKNFVIICCVLIFIFIDTNPTQHTFYFSSLFFPHSPVSSHSHQISFLSSTHQRLYSSVFSSSSSPKRQYISFTHQRLYSSALLLHPKDKKKPKEEEASSSLKPRRYFFGKDYFIFVRTSPMVYVNLKFFL